MFVGREGPLEALRSAAARAASGAGSTAALVGAGGIGKTRLADELTARLAEEGFHVHWGRASETGGAPAYWPWIEVLEAVAANAAAVPPPAIASLLARGQRGGVEDARAADPGEARFALMQAIARFLKDASRGAPLLVVLDDLHVADLPTLEAASFVARGLRSSRVLFLCTWREVEARAPAVADPIARIAREAMVIPLAALARPDVAALLLASSHRQAGDPRLLDVLHGRTEGNPLFVHEALRLLATGAPLEDLARTSGVGAIVRDRVARLDPDAQEILPAAAALGRDVDLGLLAAVAEVAAPEAERRLVALERAGVLEKLAGEWVFSHVLVREALYETIAPDRRRSLHARAAAALERRVDAGDEGALWACVHHGLLALPEIDAPRAVAFALRAALRARSDRAYEDAVAILERALAALEVCGDLPEQKAELLLALGWAAIEAGRGETAREALRGATALARASGDARLFARAALGRGAVFILGDRQEDLIALLEEAIAKLEPGEIGLRARLRARLSAALVPGREVHAAIAMARDAIEAVKGSPDDRLVLEVAVSAGSAITEFVDPNERIAVNQELVRRARRLGDRVLELRGLSRLTAELLEIGDVVRADATLAMRDELAVKLALPRYQWQAPLYRSMRAMIEGRFDDCDAAVAEAEARAAEAADDNARRCVAVHKTWLYLLADRKGALAAHEPEALRAVAGMNGAEFFQSAVSGAVAAHLGDVARAREAVARVPLEEMDHLAAPMLLATFTEAVLAAGDAARARDVLARLAPHHHRNATWGVFGLVCLPSLAAYAARLHRMVGERDEAERLFEVALERARSMRAAAHEAWIDRWCEGDRAADSARLGAAGPYVPGPMAFSLSREGDGWVVERAGRRHKLKALRGVEMLARLVERRGQEVHATELAANPAAEGEAADAGDAGDMIDERAKTEYRRRLVALREDLEEAQALGKVDQIERIHEEMEALGRELARAVGLGGRVRRSGSAAERARVSVQRRLREAIRRIAEVDPELGRHLDWGVRTGAFCAYDPDGTM